MHISDEFYDFCLYLHQDSFHVYGTEPEDLVRGAMNHMSPEQRLALRNYVVELLEGGLSYDELQAIWSRTDAEISCRGESSLRNFLGLVRDMAPRSTPA